MGMMTRIALGFDELDYAELIKKHSKVNEYDKQMYRQQGGTSATSTVLYFNSTCTRPTSAVG